MKAGANCFKFNGKLSCWIATPLLLYLRVHWSGIRSSRHFRFRPQEVDHSVLNQPRNCHNTKQCFKQNKYTLCSILRCKDCLEARLRKCDGIHTLWNPKSCDTCGSLGSPSVWRQLPKESAENVQCHHAKRFIREGEPLAKHSNFYLFIPWIRRNCLSWLVDRVLHSLGRCKRYTWCTYEPELGDFLTKCSNWKIKKNVSASRGHGSDLTMTFLSARELLIMANWCVELVASSSSELISGDW